MTIQELEQKLDEWLKTVSKEEMIKILKEEGFEVIDKESKKEGKWKPKSAEEYWFRNTDKGEIESICRYEGDGWDDWRVNNIPIFKTEEECRRYWHFMDTVKEKSYEFSKEEWEDDNINKYIITYCNHIKDISVSSMNHYNTFGEIHFKTEEDAKYIIDNFKDELMEYWI